LIEKDITVVAIALAANDLHLDEDDKAALRRVFDSARLGDAVNAMPANSSLHHLPMNSNEIAPTGFMPWVFKRPGEDTTDAADPLTALTFHLMPEGGEPQ
jgi:hypothetical protein